MFNQILTLVKEQIGNNPAIAAAIPAHQQDAVQNEIASHVASKVPGPDANGILSMLGGLNAESITAGLAEKLTSKFGLPASVTSTIVAALPGLLQQLTGKAGAAPDNILNALPGNLGSKLGGFFN